MGVGVAEDGEQAVPLSRCDMALILLDSLTNHVAVSSDHQPVGLGLDLGGQHRRVHQIGEHDCQAPYFATVDGSAEQVFGVLTVPVGGEDLLGKPARGGVITLVDCFDGTVQQLFDPGPVVRVRCCRVRTVHTSTSTSSTVGAATAAPDVSGTAAISAFPA